MSTYRELLVQVRSRTETTKTIRGTVDYKDWSLAKSFLQVLRHDYPSGSGQESIAALDKIVSLIGEIYDYKEVIPSMTPIHETINS